MVLQIQGAQRQRGRVVSRAESGPAAVKAARRGRGRNRLKPELLALEDRRLLSTFQVTNPADDNSNGTLRWAVAQANAATSASSIEFELGTAAATVTLTQGQLELTNTKYATTIYNGLGQGPVTVSGNGASRVFQVDSGVSASITGLTISGGSTSGSGGGLYNAGTATLTACTMTGNSAAVGGGLVNVGQMTVTGSTIAGNSAGTGGGLADVGQITMTNSTITGNSAGTGGGLYEAGLGTLTACTITGNSATIGGGIGTSASVKVQGAASLEDTIVAGNTGTGGAPSDIGGGSRRGKSRGRTT